MYGRAGFDRFKKAQTLEPFSVTTNSTSKSNEQPASKGVVHLSPSFLQSQTPNQQTQHQNPHFASQKPVVQDVTPAVVPTQQVTQVGGAQSTWQPPDWAIEPCPGVYYLEVIKDGEVLDRINLDKRRHIFGRQFHACDFVLDHQSVSRQHAAVIPHKNGSIYVIDLGSAHGTFVANERLTKDSTVELEVGQSLRFAASTRTYVLRKNNAALFPTTPLPTEISQPPSPDPSDEEAVLAYNTFLNRYGLKKSNLTTSAELTRSSSGKDDTSEIERAKKRIRKTRVTFRDQVGGQLVEVVGFSDGADVETEPGPVGVKEGSLVGKYESLVQVTVIPKGKEHSSGKEVSVSPKGMTDKLQQVLNKVKSAPKIAGIYDDLYGESFSANMGSSWANNTEEKIDSSIARSAISSNSGNTYDEDEDDLFGD